MGLEGVHRSEVDDASPDPALQRLRLHVAYRRDHHVVGAFDVDPVGSVPLRVGDLEHWTTRVDGGAVDQGVDPTQFADNRLEGGVALGTDLDVASGAGRRQPLRTRRCERRLGGLGVKVDDPDAGGAFVDDPSRQEGAETRPASDDDDREVVHINLQL